MALEKGGFNFGNASWYNSAQWLYLFVPCSHAIWWELPGQSSLKGIWDALDLFSPSLTLWAPAMCYLFLVYQYKVRQIYLEKEP